MSRKPAPLAPRAKDAIPSDAIRLSEAFVRVHDAAKQNPKILESIPEWAQDNILSMIDILKHEEDCLEPNELDESIEMLVKAAALFRISLNEELETYVRDPDHDRLLRLNHEDWFFCDERVPIEFNDWLSMSATPGPVNETIIRGKRRPVFLLKDQFNK
jgi:excisionase family DNA binding protein